MPPIRWVGLVSFIALVLSCTGIDYSENDKTIETDRAALLEFWDVMNGESWRFGWDITTDPCKTGWYGVACSLQGRVTGITLSNNHVMGELPASLANMTQLTSLWLGTLDVTSLDRNYVFGTIPPALGNLTLLESLALDHNLLTGTVPSTFGQLTELRYLDLSGNRLGGSLPTELSSLVKLSSLRLNGNRLTGAVTPLSAMTRLEVVDLSDNDFSADIAAMLGSTPFLRSIEMRNNPKSTVQAATLDVYAQSLNHYGTLSQDKDSLLDLYQNGGKFWVQTTGWSIPTSDPCVTRWHGVTCNDQGRVVSLDLSNNNLTGTLARSIGQLSALISIDLSSNQLRGALPVELGNCVGLRTMVLTHNYFEGGIPEEYSSLANLQSLDISHNFLSKPLPDSLGSLPHLAALKLDHNRIGGSITPTLGRLRGLLTLDLSVNRLTGQLPADLGDLKKLRELRVEYNMLVGTLPKELGALAQLQLLTLHDNRISGSIPDEMGGTMQSLEHMDIARNRLGGTLPATIGDIPRLAGCHLAGNNFTGTLPPALGKLGSTLIALSLADNKLTGYFPPFLANLTRLTILDLRRNSLSGFLPLMMNSSRYHDIADGLLLSGNRFSCPVPDWPSLMKTDCATSSCPVGFISTGRKCIRCRPGFFRHADSSVCTRCPASVVSEHTVNGTISGPACATLPADKNGQDGAIICRPCSLVTGNSSLVMADETSKDIIVTGVNVDSEGIGSLYFNGSGNYPTGTTYRGEYRGGMPHGIGTLVMATGRYNGEFAYGKRHGLGTFTTLGHDTYTGEWSEDQTSWPGEVNTWEGAPHGRGIQRLVSKSETYEGAFRLGKRHGRGVLAYLDGTTYAGEFVAGSPNGLGVQEYADGGSFTGEFVNGMRQGNGTMLFASGDIYEGQWKNDTMHGYGEFWTFNGFLYRGDWETGLEAGHGTWVDQRTGDVFIGDFIAGVKHGFGVMHYGNGDSIVGHWKDDQRHGDASVHYVDPFGTRTGAQFFASYMFDVARRRIKPVAGVMSGSGPTNTSLVTQLVPTIVSNPNNVSVYRWDTG